LKPDVRITRLSFSDGTAIELGRNDVVVIVGANNAGKSATLRAIAEKLDDSNESNPVVRAISFKREGTLKELIVWLEATTRRDISYGDYFSRFDKQISRSNVAMLWEKQDSIGSLSGFFCCILNAEERLKAANPPDSIAIATDPLRHPIHVLQWDDSEEKRISDLFKRAFGTGIVVHRHAGKVVPILIGNEPPCPAGKDRHSIEYVRELSKLPRAHDQGDGMRSFLGVLLFTALGAEPILLIDEPEAFLHPPQARHLGHFLVTETGSDRQIFVATHSGDVLRGMLNSEDQRVRVIRLRREGDRNIARQLVNSQVAQVWSDPLLRHSNILDGLFHERVIVCESDSDCRFYSAVADATFETDAGKGRRPDVMFTHSGGKARLALIIRSLRDLDVPISVVTDFDVLNAESPLKEIVEAAGGNWRSLKSDWNIVRTAIDNKKPELNLAEVRNNIENALQSVKGYTLTETAKKQIQDTLRASSPWSTAKSVGRAFIPNGDASQAADRLLLALEAIGVFVVPVGELEQFVKVEGGHGPAWVTNALKRDLKADPQLEAARQFVHKIVI